MMNMPSICAVPPVYTPESRQTLGLLQQLQTKLNPHAVETATLTDVYALADDDCLASLATLQIEFGADALLEDVIQCLVFRQFSDQYATRRKRKGVAA